MEHSNLSNLTKSLPKTFLSLHILKVSSCRSRSGGSKLRPVASLTITESGASGCFGQWEMISLLQNWEAVSRVVLQLRSIPCRGVQLEVQVQLDGISSSYYWASGCRASHGKPLAPSSGGRKQIVCSVGQSLLSSFCKGSYQQNLASRIKIGLKWPLMPMRPKIHIHFVVWRCRIRFELSWFWCDVLEYVEYTMPPNIYAVLLKSDIWFWRNIISIAVGFQCPNGLFSGFYCFLYPGL